MRFSWRRIPFLRIWNFDNLVRVVGTRLKVLYRGALMKLMWFVCAFKCRPWYAVSGRPCGAIPFPDLFTPAACTSSTEDIKLIEPTAAGARAVNHWNVGFAKFGEEWRFQESSHFIDQLNCEVIKVVRRIRHSYTFSNLVISTVIDSAYMYCQQRWLKLIADLYLHTDQGRSGSDRGRWRVKARVSLRPKKYVCFR